MHEGAVQLKAAGVAIACLAWLVAATAAAAPSPSLPLRFEESRAGGFVARGRGHALELTAAQARVRFADSDRAITLALAGANAAAPIAGEAPSAAPSHFLLGADPARWRRDVRGYERVRVRGARPGVDVLWYGHEGALEFDLEMAAGVDPAVLALDVDGADAVALGADGGLALRAGDRTLALRAPVAWQERAGVREPVAARFTIDGTRVGFAIGARDASLPLVIDPVLSVASYLGGSAADEGRAVAVDAAGAIYVAGETISLDFPATPGAAQTQFGGGVQDAFVAKLDASGSKLLWVTYLGGSLHDRGFAIAVDAYGGAVLTGRTGSLDFPTVAALQSSLAGGGDDAFVAKLTPDGSALVFSTYLGGAANDRGLAIGVDANGEVVVGGITLSPDFPTAGAFQPAYGGGSADGFVAKLAAGGAALVFASFVGGAATDNVRGLALDARDRVLLCGDTASADFPVAQARQPVLGGGFDAWVGRVDSAGVALAPATYHGGGGNDFALGCDTNAAGEAVLGGITASTDFPTVAPAQASAAGGLDAFVAKLDATLQSVVYSTYLGGSATDFGLDVALDASGAATLVGSSQSIDHPVVNALQPTNAGGFDTVLARFGRTGALEWSTYLGGSGGEIAFDRMGVAVDAQGRALVTGITQSANHPLAVPVQSVWGGADDASFARVGSGPEPRVSLAPDAAGTRLRLALANGAAAAKTVELKIWIALPSGPVVGLIPEPLSIPIAPQGFVQLVDAVLPPAIAFPGAKVGARLLDPASGAVLSESICTSVPCN